MRIAFSGAHRTGKTSLVDELLFLLPGYVSFDEPYHLMSEGKTQQKYINRHGIRLTRPPEDL